MLIIFAVGAPELLLNSIGRSEVRDLVKETFKFSRSSYWLLLLLFLGAALAVTYEAMESLSGGDRWQVARGSTVAMVSSLSVTLWAVLFYVKNLRPDKIARRLEGKLSRHCAKGPEARGDGATKCFRSLAALGKAARTTDEHRGILRVFQGTIAKVIDSPKYTGDDLEVALRKMAEAIIGASYRRSPADLVHSLDCVAQTKRQVEQSRRGGPDARRVQETLQKIASFILDVANRNPRDHYEGVVERAIWGLDDEPAAQFGLLRRALETAQPVTLLRVATRLRAYYRNEEDSVGREERRARLLGFVALLRQRGRAERQWVGEQIVATLDVDLAPALEEAYERMYTAGEFAAAESLDRWRAELEKRTGGQCSNPGGSPAPLVTFHFSLFGES